MLSQHATCPSSSHNTSSVTVDACAQPCVVSQKHQHALAKATKTSSSKESYCTHFFLITPPQADLLATTTETAINTAGQQLLTACPSHLTKRVTVKSTKRSLSKIQAFFFLNDQLPHGMRRSNELPTMITHAPTLSSRQQQPNSRVYHTCYVNITTINHYLSQLSSDHISPIRGAWSLNAPVCSCRP